MKPYPVRSIALEFESKGLRFSWSTTAFTVLSVPNADFQHLHMFVGNQSAPLQPMSPLPTSPCWTKIWRFRRVLKSFNLNLSSPLRFLAQSAERRPWLSTQTKTRKMMAPSVSELDGKRHSTQSRWKWWKKARHNFHLVGRSERLLEVYSGVTI